MIEAPKPSMRLVRPAADRPRSSARVDSARWRRRPAPVVQQLGPVDRGHPDPRGGAATAPVVARGGRRDGRHGERRDGTEDDGQATLPHQEPFGPERGTRYPTVTRLARLRDRDRGAAARRRSPRRIRAVPAAPAADGWTGWRSSTAPPVRRAPKRASRVRDGRSHARRGGDRVMPRAASGRTRCAAAGRQSAPPVRPAPATSPSRGTRVARQIRPSPASHRSGRRPPPGRSAGLNSRASRSARRPTRSWSAAGAGYVLPQLVVQPGQPGHLGVPRRHQGAAGGGAVPGHDRDRVLVLPARLGEAGQPEQRQLHGVVLAEGAVRGPPAPPGHRLQQLGADVGVPGVHRDERPPVRPPQHLDPPHHLVVVQGVPPRPAPPPRPPLRQPTAGRAAAEVVYGSHA